jgi:hypothetical protein
MAGNSTIQLQTIVDDASSLGDVAPALATGGWSTSVALSIANDVMTAILQGGPDGQPFNWKWNRLNLPAFVTISWQQDYFIPGLSNLGWLENCFASNINQTSIPKQKLPMEVFKDLDITYAQTGWLDKICWIPNRLAQTGTWGLAPLGPTANNLSGQTTAFGSNFSGLQNPGPSVIYTNPLGLPNNVINATTCITDPNGNLWTVTAYGTCGTTQPTWPNPVTYPTYQNPTTVATTVNDGTVVWTAIDPNGQAFRLNPLPPQTGVVWLVQPVGQARKPMFTSLKQTLDPIPDDWSSYFKQGFFAECYRRNPDPKIRARYAEEYKLWMKALDKEVRQASNEKDDYGFYPGRAGVMEPGFINIIRPDYPYGPTY